MYLVRNIRAEFLLESKKRQKKKYVKTTESWHTVAWKGYDSDENTVEQAKGLPKAMLEAWYKERDTEGFEPTKHALTTGTKTLRAGFPRVKTFVIGCNGEPMGWLKKGQCWPIQPMQKKVTSKKIKKAVPKEKVTQKATSKKTKKAVPKKKKAPKKKAQDGRFAGGSDTGVFIPMGMEERRLSNISKAAVLLKDMEEAHGELLEVVEPKERVARTKKPDPLPHQMPRRSSVKPSDETDSVDDGMLIDGKDLSDDVVSIGEGVRDDLRQVPSSGEGGWIERVESLSPHQDAHGELVVTRNVLHNMEMELNFYKKDATKNGAIGKYMTTNQPEGVRHESVMRTPEREKKTAEGGRLLTPSPKSYKALVQVTQRYVISLLVIFDKLRGSEI
jgi:hypothetical protein